MAVSVPDKDLAWRMLDVTHSLRDPASTVDRRAWWRWNGAGARTYTIGVEEEVMLLDPTEHAFAQRSDAVLSHLSEPLRRHTSRETHAAVIELATGVHFDTAGAVAELAALRERLTLELHELGLVPAAFGTHPLATKAETQVSGGERYRLVSDSMRSLARREPTAALHVHVGVPDPDDAVRLLNRLRENVPVLLALSANSPFSGGRDSGFASWRTVIFGGFPRTGTPRRFTSYTDYTEAIDPLIASGALPDATFLWWDVRLQPALGTVEVRVMDSQSALADTAPLVALIQSLARLQLEGTPHDARIGPEVLAENRFLAARDGLDARLIDAEELRLVPVRALVEKLLWQCRPHAAELRCAEELQSIRRLAANNGASRQRAWARHEPDLARVVSRLAGQFTPGRELVSDVIPGSERSD